MSAPPKFADLRETPPSVEENLAFLRAVAENGRRTAALSGDYLILWGVLTALADLNHFAINGGVYGREGFIGAGYATMVVLGWAGTFMLARRSAGRSRAMPTGARVYAVIFGCAGIALTIFAMGAAVTSAPTTMIPIVAALMIGICFLSTGLLSAASWLTVVGGIWMVAAIIGFFLTPYPVLQLFCAGLWLAFMAGPGVVLSRRRRRLKNPECATRPVADPRCDPHGFDVTPTD